MTELRLTCSVFWVDLRLLAINGWWLASADTPDGPSLGLGERAIEAIESALEPFEGIVDELLGDSPKRAEQLIRGVGYGVKESSASPATLVFVALALITAACGLQPPPTPKPTPSPTPVIQEIIGVDSHHRAITDPLRQIIPSVPPNPAYVAITFSDTEGVSLGIEGALLFLRATAASGSVMVDRMIDWKGSTQGLSAGAYTLLAYYQPCDGNCWMLDGEQPFCSTESVLKTNGRYHLTVRVNKHLCEVSEW